MNVTTRRQTIRWDENKKNIVRKRYPLGDKKQLARELGISLKAVKHMARKMGVASQQDKRFYKLKPLYEDSVLSYYWMGFVMADGHITKRGQLSVSLSVKDRIHLEKFSKFLNVTLHDYQMRTNYDNSIRDYCRISCLDTYYGPKLTHKFNLNGKPKTSNPPTTLDFTDPRYLLAFFIGFIDGDGSMEKNESGCMTAIKLEMHGAWKHILESLCRQLSKINIGNTSVRINKRGYAFVRLHKYKNFRYLKRFALHHELPILERKWNRIDENKQTDRVKKSDLPLDCNYFYD